jgi:hypothetical protein
MQLPTTALLLTTLTTLSLAASSKESICRAKSIRAFCARTDLVANAPYAMEGKYAGPNQIGTHAFIAAKSKCPSSSNWVPQKYCFEQFYETCAKGDDKGRGRRSYGAGLCQEFNLQVR